MPRNPKKSERGWRCRWKTRAIRIIGWLAGLIRHIIYVDTDTDIYIVMWLRGYAWRDIDCEQNCNAKSASRLIADRIETQRSASEKI